MCVYVYIFADKTIKPSFMCSSFKDSVLFLGKMENERKIEEKPEKLCVVT